jgi:hypothetical protein
MNIDNIDDNIDTHEDQSNTSSSDSSNQPGPHIQIDVHDDVDIELGEIHEANTLMHYTDNHFVNMASSDLHRLQDEYKHTTDECYTMIRRNNERCDSPMTISNYGSRSGSSNNSDDEDVNTIQQQPLFRKQISLDDIAGQLQSSPSTNNLQVSQRKHKRRQSKFKQLAYHDVEKTLDKYYDMEIDNKFSSELDILTTYMKGQKNVYIQSKQLSQWRHYCLMIPSLLITCGMTIFADFVKCDSDNKWIMTVLNATIGLLIALMNFLKLESATTVYLHLANQYDKLEVSLEMTNSKLVLMTTEGEKKTLVLNQIHAIEEKMNEIKEVNNVLIPAEMKQIFPIICHVNIFSFIKKLENHRQILILKFKDIQNEIRFILHKWEKEEFELEEPNNMNVAMLQRKMREKEREQNRLTFLYEIKDKLKVDLSDCRNAYGNMDVIFTTEIKQAERETGRLGIWFVCLWRQCFTSVRMKNINPVLDKYFHFLFTDE